MHHGSIRKLHLDLSREEPLNGHLVVTKAGGWRNEGHFRLQEQLKLMLQSSTAYPHVKYIIIIGCMNMSVTKCNKTDKLNINLDEDSKCSCQSVHPLFIKMCIYVIFLCAYIEGCVCLCVKVCTCVCSSMLSSVQFFWWSMKISAFFFSFIFIQTTGSEITRYTHCFIFTQHFYQMTVCLTSLAVWRLLPPAALESSYKNLCFVFIQSWC